MKHLTLTGPQLSNIRLGWEKNALAYWRRRRRRKVFRDWKSSNKMEKVDTTFEWKKNFSPGTIDNGGYGQIGSTIVIKIRAGGPEGGGALVGMWAGKYNNNIIVKVVTLVRFKGQLGPISRPGQRTLDLIVFCLLSKHLYDCATAAPLVQ
jgi:hypothetical protein